MSTSFLKTELIQLYLYLEKSDYWPLMEVLRVRFELTLSGRSLLTSRFEDSKMLFYEGTQYADKLGKCYVQNREGKSNKQWHPLVDPHEVSRLELVI